MQRPMAGIRVQFGPNHIVPVLCSPGGTTKGKTMGRTTSEGRIRALLVIAVILATLASGSAVANQDSPQDAAHTTREATDSTRGDGIRPEPGTAASPFVAEQNDLASLPANSGRTLVFGEDDNGFEGDAIAALLDSYHCQSDNRLSPGNNKIATFFPEHRHHILSAFPKLWLPFLFPGSPVPPPDRKERN